MLGYVFYAPATLNDLQKEIKLKNLGKGWIPVHCDLFGEQFNVFFFAHFNSTFSALCRLLSERSRVSLGPVLGGRPDDNLLFYGSAMVRGCYRHLHRPHWLSENGDRDVSPRGTTQIPGCQVCQQDCWIQYVRVLLAFDCSYFHSHVLIY